MSKQLKPENFPSKLPFTWVTIAAGVYILLPFDLVPIGGFVGDLLALLSAVASTRNATLEKGPDRES